MSLQTKLKGAGEAVESTRQQAVKAAALQRRQYISYALMVLSCFFWVLGYIYSNNHDVSPVQTMMLRGVMITLGSYCICKYYHESLDLKQNLKKMTIRNVMMMSNGMIISWAQFYLPLPVVHTICCTGSLSVSVWEWALRGKPFTRQLILSMVIVVGGVTLVSNGRAIEHWLTGKQFTTEFPNYKSDSPWVIFGVILLLGLSELSWGYIVLLTQEIKASSNQINFHFGFLILIFNSTMYLFVPKRVAPEVFYEGLIWTGGTLFLAETFFVLGIVLAVHPGRTMILTMSVMVFAYLFSAQMYGEALSWVCLIGSGIIVLGILMIILE